MSMTAGEIVYNQPHLISKILYEFGGLSSKTAICFKKDTKISFEDKYTSDDRLSIINFDMNMKIKINEIQYLLFSSYVINQKISYKMFNNPLIKFQQSIFEIPRNCIRKFEIVDDSDYEVYSSDEDSEFL
jgi:hypothetical protein